MERRSIRPAPADDSRFPGARQVFRIRRGVGDLDNLWTTIEIVYGIASLPASPEHLNCYERQHRTVGNRLHWTRDVTSHVNFSQLRTSTAARALASYRNLTNPQQSNRTKITTPGPWLRLG
jgi:hypothetical protein